MPEFTTEEEHKTALHQMRIKLKVTASNLDKLRQQVYKFEQYYNDSMRAYEIEQRKFFEKWDKIKRKPEVPTSTPLAQAMKELGISAEELLKQVR